MKPVNQNFVSIQLPLGGHSFSSSDIRGIAPNKSTNVYAVVDTAKCVVLPREHIDFEHVEDALRSCGITLRSDEVAVCSTDAPMMAVMAVNAKCLATLALEYGSRLRFTSPILNCPMPDHGSVIYLSSTSNVLYVRVADGGLKFIETMEVESDADILYMLENINKVYNIYNMYARAEGDTRRLLSLCKRLFSKMVCEL